MRPPHPLKDIAAQAGLSEATVDRALHGRSNVSAAAVRAVERRMTELGVSWQIHLFGDIGGVIAASMLKRGRAAR